MKLVLNMPFITLNKYIAADRANRYKGGSIKKRQTNNVAYLIKAQNFELEPGRYNLIFSWYVPNNRTDHDNISFAKKFILDGLVVAGVLPDDSPKYVGNFQDLFILDKVRKYISCNVEFQKTK